MIHPNPTIKSLAKNQIIAIAAVVIIVVAAAAVAVVMTGDDSPDDYSEGAVTITTFVDYNGNTADITFESVPERVVVGCNTALNLLLYLGLGDRIVGIYYDEEEVWDEVADEYRKVLDRIGEDHHLTGNISTDVLLSWEPDLVIGWVSWNSDGLGTEEFFNENGCNVMSLNTMTSSSYRTLELMKTDYDNIGAIFDCKDKTDALYDAIIDVYNTAVAAVGANTTGDIYYALVDGAVNTSSGTVWAYKDSNFIASVLNGMGLKNAFPDGGTVSLATVYEAIGTTDIDLIIYITYGSVTYENSLESWENDADLSQCAAIKNGHTIDMKLSCSYGSSPELLTALEQISEYIVSISS